MLYLCLMLIISNKHIKYNQEIFFSLPCLPLTYSNSLHGMHSTTIASEATQPGKSHLLELANEFRLKNRSVIIDQVADAVSQWKWYAKDVGFTKESMDIIEKKMQGTLN